MAIEQEKFEQWAILEYFGHQRTAGLVTEENRFGGIVGRIDIPNGGGPDGKMTTQYFGPNSIFRLTPTTEPIARMVAVESHHQPISPWELSAIQLREGHREPGEYTEGDDFP